MPSINQWVRHGVWLFAWACLAGAAHAAESDFLNFEVGQACGNEVTYPKVAAEANATGTTRVRVNIDELGRIRKAEVLKSAGDTKAHKALDMAVMKLLGCEGLFKRTGEAYEREIEYRWKLD